MSSLVRIKESNDLSIVGDYLQGGKMIGEYNFDAPNSTSALSMRRGKEVNFIPDMGTIQISGMSKITDVLSIGLIMGSGLVVSEKFKLLLDTKKLQNEVYFFEMDIVRRKVHYKYYWMHLYADYGKFIDYRNSMLYVPGKGEMQFKSYEAALAFKKEHSPFQMLRLTKVRFKKPECLNFDLLYIGPFDKNIYITENFKNELTFNKITGLEYISATIFD